MNGNRNLIEFLQRAVGYSLTESTQEQCLFGIWRRIKLVPFDVKIPPERQDKDLLNKLKTELPGILVWAVDGCLKWLKNGLSIPDEVTAATAAYKGEMDVISADDEK